MLAHVPRVGVVALLMSVVLGSVVRPVEASPPPDQQPPAGGTGRVYGLVLDRETRAPLRGAVVRVTSSARSAGLDVLTDDEGRFDLRELAPGAYALRVTKRAYVAQPYGRQRPGDSPTPIQVTRGQTVGPVQFLLSRGAVITGRVVDELGEPLDSVTVRVLASEFTALGRRFRTVAMSLPTNDLGEYRVSGLAAGRYAVAAVSPDVAAYGGITGVVLDTSARPPTYFPGTTDPGAAERLTLRLNQTASSIDITVRAIPTATISGRVREAAGGPVTVTRVVAVPAGSDLAPVRAAPVLADGTFRLLGVPTGEYVLRTGDPASNQRGDTPVTIAGAAVEQVDIEARPPTVLVGRIRFAASAGGVDVSAFRVNAIDRSWGARAGGSARATVAGQFRLTSAPGRVLLRLAAAPPGWTLRRVIVAGQDATDDGVDVMGTTTPLVEMWVANDDPELVVAVVDQDGRVVRDAWVVVFAADAQRWTFGSRYIGFGRPNRLGQWRQRLPAGDYLVAAVDTLEPGDAYDPQVLRALETVPVSLGDRPGGVAVTVTMPTP